MSADRSLGDLPRVRVEVVEDRTASATCDAGFLRMRRLVLRNVYEDGHQSAEYRYDLVERDAMDAVAIVLVARDETGPSVCLRSALRPPLAFRPGYTLPIPEPEPVAVLWEIPAGLVEAGEHGVEGLRACAARETLEEVGLALEPDAFGALGPAASLSPGVIGEKIHFLFAQVDPAARGVPTEDGSPVEARAEVRFVPIGDALAAVRDGRIADLKTEVAVRRIAALEGVR